MSSHLANCIRQLGWRTICYRLAKRAELMDKLNNRPATGISQVPVVYSKSRNEVPFPAQRFSGIQKIPEGKEAEAEVVQIPSICERRARGI